jgi:regulator of replication initiation timing
MSIPSLRKLENDLEINKTTLHNWKKSRPKLYEFIIESYKDKELLKKNLTYLVEQRNKLEVEIQETKQRVS